MMSKQLREHACGDVGLGRDLDPMVPQVDGNWRVVRIEELDTSPHKPQFRIFAENLHHAVDIVSWQYAIVVGKRNDLASS